MDVFAASGNDREEFPALREQVVRLVFGADPPNFSLRAALNSHAFSFPLATSPVDESLHTEAVAAHWHTTAPIETSLRGHYDVNRLWAFGPGCEIRNSPSHPRRGS
jgi:hypothetical protein